MAKNDYTCVVFFHEGAPKKWTYVHSLLGFKRFLDQKHSGWKYCNVYDRRKTNFLTRFYPGQFVPPFIRSMILIVMLLGVATSAAPKPLNSTFSNSTFKGLERQETGFTFFLTFNSSEGTFNYNGFNNTATISTSQNRKGGLL